MYKCVYAYVCVCVRVCACVRVCVCERVRMCACALHRHSVYTDRTTETHIEQVSVTSAVFELTSCHLSRQTYACHTPSLATHMYGT